MKTLLVLSLALLPAVALAEHMDYVDFSLNLPAVKALKTAYPVCEAPVVRTEVEEGITQFTITQDCKVSDAARKGMPNESVTITITGTSAPWGEIGGVEVKISEFCAGNCEV